MSAVYPSLRGKRILITGGASGIGAALVEAFAGQGATVTLLDVAHAEGETLAATLGVTFRYCDLADLDQLAAAIAATGPVDVLINNAASDDRHSVAEVTPSYWDQRMAVNLRHLFFCAQAVAPTMKAAGGGVIVNFGSISWHLGLPDLVLYQTAKAAIEGMTRGLARELGPDGIRVVTVVPGNVETERQKRWYTPEGEAEIVAAQCLDGRVQPSDVAVRQAKEDKKADVLILQSKSPFILKF